MNKDDSLFSSAESSDNSVTLYFIDNTGEQWIKKDVARMESAGSRECI